MTTVTQVIGTAGGEITLLGATLNIPAGALTEDTSITVSRSEASTVEGF